MRVVFSPTDPKTFWLGWVVFSTTYLSKGGCASGFQHTGGSFVHAGNLPTKDPIKEWLWILKSSFWHFPPFSILSSTPGRSTDQYLRSRWFPFIFIFPLSYFFVEKDQNTKLLNKSHEYSNPENSFGNQFRRCWTGRVPFRPGPSIMFAPVLWSLNHF